MSQYRLNPTQEAVLQDHCGHARYIWNLAVEQHSHWHPGRVSAPGYPEQCRQLTAARGGHPWLAAGSRESPGRGVRARAGLDRGMLGSGWGLLVRRLQEEAPGRVEKINPAFTSQRCSACGRVDRGSRESQAVFRCTACGFAVNADVNAAINIAAGHPTHLPIPLHARGGDGVTRPV